MPKDFWHSPHAHRNSVSSAKFKINNAQKAEAKFDLILCDWEMPNADGLELLQYIRRDVRFKSVGFFRRDRYGRPERVKRAIQHQANSFIVKPIERQQLEQKLVAYLAASS